MRWSQGSGSCSDWLFWESRDQIMIMRFLVESNLMMILGVFTSQIANKIECVSIIIYTSH